MTLLRTTYKLHKTALFVVSMVLLAVAFTMLAWRATDTRLLRRTARTLKHLCVEQAGSLAQQYAEELLSDASQALLGQHEDVRLRQTVLKVRRIAQAPELPQGCECTAAATVLNYLGIPSSKTDLADNFLVKLSPAVYANPNEAYMGDPRGDGWYCYAPPLENAVNRYLNVRDLNASYQAVDITGTSPATLRRHIYEGRPVIVWATLGFRVPAYSTRFSLSDGSPLYSNLHCLVLTGYDETHYFFADPLCETYAVNKETFETRYAEMGQHAMLICETPQAMAQSTAQEGAAS